MTTIKARDLLPGMKLNVGTTTSPKLGTVLRVHSTDNNPRAKTMQVAWSQDDYAYDLGGQFAKSYLFKLWEENA